MDKTRSPFYIKFHQGLLNNIGIVGRNAIWNNIHFHFYLVSNLIWNFGFITITSRIFILQPASHTASPFQTLNSDILA